jgi:hypothetical protein
MLALINQTKETKMSNIQPGHVRAFQMVRSPLYENILLESCTINGEQGVAIIAAERASETHIAVMPLFVAITDSMEIDFPRIGGGGSDGGGGPKNPKEDFRASKAPATKPEVR